MSSGFADAGMPSEKTRTVSLRCSVSPGVVLPPTMSLLRTPSMFQFCSRAICAKCLAPSSPCSSPATVRKISVAGNLYLLRTRAHSRLTAVPLASSLAPGAGSFVFSVSELRES